MTPIRRLTVTAGAAIVLAAAAAATPAGGATAGKFGRDSGSCDWPALTQPFLPWADPGQYFLAPGGNFENGTNGWTLTGNANIVSGNETYYVGSSSDSHSLALPDTTSSATTPTMCVTALSPDFRLFLFNKGANGHTDGQLAVYLNFTGADGKPQQVKIAALKNGTSWGLTLPISFIQYISGPLKNGLAYVSFTFKPNDNHGNWLLDDLYVDPIKHA